MRAARGNEDHSPARLIRAQLAAVTVRDRGNDSGDVAQGNDGDGRTPGLVESLGQAGPEDNERVGASRKGGEYPGTGHGLVVLEAERMARAGMAPDEIVAALQELTGRVEASFILDRLDYMKMGGRCSAVTLLGANLLKLRPCIEVKDGKMGVGKKYRGSFEKCLVQYITDKLGARSDLELRRVFITHSGLPEEMVQKAVETVQKLQPFDEICVTRAGCTVSSHCGPGTIGVLYIRKAEA